jgi:thiosulfate/3-mercaptopyruvate sulfurtransferase
MLDLNLKNRWVTTAEDLYRWSPQAQIVVVDCRFSLADPSLGRRLYSDSHIPGAHYLDLNQDLSSPVQPHGGRHPLPNLDQFASKLTAMGVRSGEDATWVVAYDDSRFAFASRLWWLLRYLGHDQVAVLDGGFQGWQAAGYSVTADLPQPRVGSFIPQVRPERAVDIATVQARQNGVVLVDSREAERYRGEHEPIDPVAGHIPGAVNYPWQEVTDPQGYVLPELVQQQRWATLPPYQELIVYCGSGVTACVNLLSLEIAGISSAKLYPGSWSDWCSYL